MDAPPTSGVRLVRALTRATRAVVARVEPVVKAEGLTLDQWLAIEALAGTRGRTMADLATDTELTGPTLTRVVDKLVLSALAYREVDPADRRKVRVYLSPRGRGAYRRIAGKLAELQQAMLAGVPLPDQLLDALDQLAH